MQLLSIQTADPERLDVSGRVITTGIRKRPVDAALLTTSGISGDTIGNTRHHGGADQAVYAYSAEDLRFWEAQLGRTIAPGLFGENLVLSSFGDGPVRIGDRYAIGDVELEVTSPRIPCDTFSAVMDEPDWIRRFRDARRPGWYARVIAGGTVRVGDPVERRPAPATNVELLTIQDLYYDSAAPEVQLRAALDSPIAERARAALEERLAG